MLKQSLPAVSDVTAETLEEFKTMDKIVLVAYTGSDDKAANEAFTTLADAQRDNYLFGTTDDAAVAEAEGVKQPSIILYKDFDEKKAIYDGQFEQEDLLTWIKTASTPLVGEVNPETYSNYMSVSNPPSLPWPRFERKLTPFSNRLVYHWHTSSLIPPRNASSLSLTSSLSPRSTGERSTSLP